MERKCLNTLGVVFEGQGCRWMLTHDVGGSGLIELVIVEFQGRAAPHCVGHRLCGKLWQPVDCVAGHCLHDTLSL